MTLTNRIKVGLDIFLKYNPDVNFGHGHDILWCGYTDIPFSDTDKKALEEAGWFVDEEYDCYAIFT